MRIPGTFAIICRPLLGWVIALIICPAIFATTGFQPEFQPSLKIDKAAEAISIDGDLNDPGWQLASRAVNFVERFPGDNTQPEVTTEAYLTYDDDNLYVAFVCRDDPTAIRATMCQRDQFEDDDAVSIFIDTYGEASWAYQFIVNPYGVQKDRLWSSIAGEDAGFDLIWKSAAQITDSGYQVELAVPFSSMRFPNRDAQTWKVDFWRNRPRDSYHQYSWAAYDRNEQCWVCQWGTVEGIANVHPGKGFEVLPAYVANQSGRMADMRQAESPFENGDVMGELSLGGKYSISSDVTLEAAFNPDFSQIESDAAQIDVNTTIALFYPERRPFFQEGADIFRTLFNSFYTRTVNDPQFAAKVTGRRNGYSFGFMSALDENTPYVIPLLEATIIRNTGKSAVNVLRASRTVGEDSQLGFLVSDRRLEDGGYGSILAFDGDIRLSQTFSIDGQFLSSYTGEPDEAGATAGLEGATFDDGKHTLVFNGESFAGTAFISRLRRNARHWDFIVDFNQVAPSYRTQTGYDPWVDYRSLSFYSSYTIYPEDGLFERITPQVYTDGRWRFDGDRFWSHMNLTLYSRLRMAMTNLSTSYRRGTESWGGMEFDNLWTVSLDVNSRVSDKFGFYLSAQRGRGVALYALTRGNETSADIGLNLKPIDRLTIEPDLSYSRSTDINTGDELFEQYVTRTRLQYQAARELSLRLVVQYDDYRHKWDIDPLLTYRLSPFSVFYLGSTYDYRDLSPSPSDTSQWRLQSRQFFMKLQYLLQI